MDVSKSVIEFEEITFPNIDTTFVWRNKYWGVRCPLDFNNSLLKKDGTPKQDVVDLALFIRRISGGWDIVYYKDLGVFRDPLDRTYWIYPKTYLTGRLRDSYQRLDIIKVDKETVVDIINTQGKFYETGFPAY